MNKIAIIMVIALQMIYCRLNGGKHDAIYFQNLNQCRISAMMIILAMTIFSGWNYKDGKDKAFAIFGGVFCIFYGLYCLYVFLPASLVAELDLLQHPIYCACIAGLTALVISLIFKPKSLA